MSQELIEKINDLLPQTQCGLCEYQGCRPYAQAMVESNETLDRCLPGGVRVLRDLGEQLRQDVEVLVPSMQQRS